MLGGGLGRASLKARGADLGGGFTGAGGAWGGGTGPSLKARGAGLRGGGGLMGAS